jgi:MoxR-like ATPase
LLHLRAAEAAHATQDTAALEASLYDRRFLLARPLLQALEDSPSVLLVDEVDRADDEFEAFLLEVLSDFTISIPELGTIRAQTPPVVVITSNRTREIHDAIKRRCLYHWVDYPDAERELAIVRRKCPAVSESLACEVVAFTQRLRALDLFKAPGIAETLDWAEALVALDRITLDPQTVADTLGALLKYQDDVAAITPDVAAKLLREAQVAA